MLDITQERDVDTAELDCMKRCCQDLDFEVLEMCESASTDPRLNGACNAQGAVRKEEAIKIGDRLNQGLSCLKHALHGTVKMDFCAKRALQNLLHFGKPQIIACLNHIHFLEYSPIRYIRKK